MNKILVPTDFSPCSEAASEVAMTIAERAKAQIYFFHLHAPEPAGGHMAMHGSGSHTGHEHHDCTGPARAQLGKLVIKAEHLGLFARPLLVQDQNWVQVKRHIRALSIDFVVLGSHGAHGVKDFLVGTNAQHLLGSVAVPLLVIKGKQPDFNHMQIIFASTFEKDLRQPLGFLNSFAALWNATVHLLFINTSLNSKEDDKVGERMSGWARHLNVPVQRPIFHSDDKEEGIYKYARHVNADIIVVANHQRTWVSRITSRGIAEKLVSHADIPVIVINQYSLQETTTTFMSVNK